MFRSASACIQQQLAINHFMFNGASAFNQAIGNWDLKYVTNMFQAIGDWDVFRICLVHLIKQLAIGM